MDTHQHHRVPSVFEVVACDSLKNGLREALRYLLDHINQIDGIRQLPIISRTDEAILLLDLIIEYNHLRSYNASYAENLYNLIRLSNRTNSKIQNSLPSLVCLTLVPYFKRKLDKYFDYLNYKETRTADELRRIRIYRIFTRSCSLLRLICLVRFAANKSNYHNILDGLLNISLVGRSDDLGNNNNNNDYLQLTWLDRSSKLIADLFGHGLTVGSYFIQFLDYWNTHSNSAPLFNASLEIPDPPNKLDDEIMVTYTDDRSSNICLICLHVRQNECALSNTGYVFCYSCLHRFVTTKHRCPITGHPATVDNIVKLFNSTITTTSTAAPHPHPPSPIITS